MSLFLSADELKMLTGFSLKNRQIVQLRASGIPFRTNGQGKPIVTRSAIEGTPDQNTTTWQPAILQFAKKAA